MPELNYPKEVIHIPIADIKTGLNRGRKSFIHIEQLMESIKTFGLIHPPVVVLDTDNKYLLIAGERRYRAMCLLGYTNVPCIKREDLNELKYKEIELEENLQREDLIWEEHIFLLAQIDDLKKKIYGKKMPGKEDGIGWSTKDTAELVGEKQAMIYRQIQFAKFLDANPKIRELVKNLPLTAAIKRAKQLEEGEKFKRLHESGKIKTLNNLLLGDAVKLIKDVKSESIDLILTDMPFGIESINVSRNSKFSESASDSYKGMLEKMDNLSPDKTIKLIATIAPDLFRVLKPSSHCYFFASISLYKELKDIFFKAGLIIYDVPIIWDKDRTTGPFMGYEFAPCYEVILYGYKPPKEKRLNEPCKSILAYSPSTIDKTHPFEKPLDLLSFLIKQSTKVGDVVIDPFAGGGNTLKAAGLLKRSGIGFEINEHNYMRAQSSLLNKE